MSVLEAIAPEAPPLVIDRNGVIRVGGTRVTLDTVVHAFERGATAEEIAQDYPSLDLADVYAAIGYYLHHRDEVEAYLARRDQEETRVRRLVEARSPSAGIRERLLARRAKASVP